jgi:hypothetical protein
MGRIIVLAWSPARFVAGVVTIGVVGLVWSARPRARQPGTAWA